LCPPTSYGGIRLLIDAVPGGPDTVIEDEIGQDRKRSTVKVSALPSEVAPLRLVCKMLGGLNERWASEKMGFPGRIARMPDLPPPG